MGFFDWLIGVDDSGSSGSQKKSGGGSGFFDPYRDDPYNIDGEKDPYIRNKKIEYLREYDPDVFDDMDD